MRAFMHKFRGVRYKIRFCELFEMMGLCDPPSSEKPAIIFDRGLKQVDLLDTVIHESLHACFPDLKEDAVNVAAADIARLITRMGFLQADQIKS